MTESKREKLKQGYLQQCQYQKIYLINFKCVKTVASNILAMYYA